MDTLRDIDDGPLSPDEAIAEARRVRDTGDYVINKRATPFLEALGGGEDPPGPETEAAVRARTPRE